MVKNYIIKPFRISEEFNSLISQVVKKTGFQRTKIVRWLFSRGLEHLKKDIHEAGSIDNLGFDIKQIRKINE